MSLYTSAMITITVMWQDACDIILCAWIQLINPNHKFFFSIFITFTGMVSDFLYFQNKT